MFRLTPKFRTTALLLRHSPVKSQICLISRTSIARDNYKRFDDPERETCPPKPELPPPKKKSYFHVYLSLAALIAGTSGFVVMAKKNPEIRDWLSIYAPWFDELVAAVYEENVPLAKSVGIFGDSCLSYVKELIKEKPSECSFDGTGIETSPSEDEEEYEDHEKSDDALAEEESPCDILPAPVVTKDPCEIEACMKDLADTVINNYMTARDACLLYNKAVSCTMLNFTVPRVKLLKNDMEERIDLVTKHSAKAESANEQMKDLVRYIECGCSAPKERLDVTRQLMRDLQVRIDRVRIEFEMENVKAGARDDQWKMVEQLVDEYTERMQMMYAGLDYRQEKPSFKGDSDFLLILTKKYVDDMQVKVQKASAALGDRATRALNSLEKPEKEMQDKIQSAYKKALTDLDKDFKQLETDLKTELDNERKTELQKQKNELEAILEAKLIKKKAEVEVKFDEMVAKAVAAKKKELDSELQEMAKQLRAVENTLDDKLEAERETKRAQELYAAGMALLAATKAGTSRVRVDRELEAINKARGEKGDPLVETLLARLPGDVWEQGVMPECVLRERYHSMEDVAMKVALIESDGAPLPLYAFSWLQGVLLCMKLTTIPQSEIDTPLKEPFTDLDTFDLLQRARYFVDRGNLAVAVQYVDSLEGASRGAAEAWYSAASSHLQTKQAAEAILAHAAAITLQYL